MVKQKQQNLATNSTDVFAVSQAVMIVVSLLLVFSLFFDLSLKEGDSVVVFVAGFLLVAAALLAAVNVLIGAVVLLQMAKRNTLSRLAAMLFWVNVILLGGFLVGVEFF